MGSKRMITLAALAAVALLVGGVAIASALSGSEAEPATTVMESRGSAISPPQAGAFSDAADDDYAIFRAPQRASDELDQDLSSKVRRLGADADTARLIVPDSGPASRQFAVKSEGGVCLVSASAGAACSTAEQARNSGLIATIECSPASGKSNILIYGLVPDGIESITLSLRDGSAISVPVNTNGWSYSPDRGVASRPYKATWGDGRTAPIPYSPDVDRAC